MNKRKNIFIFLFVIILLIVAIWIGQLLQGTEPYVDRITRSFVVWLEDSSFYMPFMTVTHLGSSFFLYPFVATVAIILIIVYRHWLPGLFFAGGIYLSHLINKGIKAIVARERPSISESLNAEGYSFPSGHAMISLVCYGLLAYFITKKLQSKSAIFIVQLFFSLLILLIGISRYVINVHYLTDVLAGFVIGFILFIGLVYEYEAIEKRKSQS